MIQPVRPAGPQPKQLGGGRWYLKLTIGGRATEFINSNRARLLDDVQTLTTIREISRVRADHRLLPAEKLVEVNRLKGRLRQIALDAQEREAGELPNIER